LKTLVSINLNPIRSFKFSNKGFPLPKTTGCTDILYMSISLKFINVFMRFAPPYSQISLSSCFFISATLLAMSKVMKVAFSFCLFHYAPKLVGVHPLEKCDKIKVEMEQALCAICYPDTV
jgi:hypothetical protein